MSMSANSSADPTSIRSLYDTATALRTSLDLLPTSSPEHQPTLQKTIAAYTSCSTAISQASLFSLNESLDDISTSNLRYLLVDFHLAELTPAIHSDPSARRPILEHARALYRRFIAQIEAYDLISASDKAALERSANPAKAAPVEPGAKRQAKIAEFRRKTELARKIETAEKGAGADEEDVRALWTAQVEMAVMKTVAALEMIALEIDVLSQAPPPGSERAREQEAEDARRRGRKVDGYNEKLDVIPSSIKGGALLSKDGKPLRPFTLVGKREALKKGVYGPGYNLPTMSIDEYLEEERARGGIIEGGGEKSGIKPELDVDDEEAVDRETMKAREWDEFMEANPKGAGNTLNRG